MRHIIIFVFGVLSFCMKGQNVGIGTTTPYSPLSFSNNLGDKISFYNNGPNKQYGIGIQGSLLQIFTSAITEDVSFGFGNSTSFTERMRIRGNGRVGIGTSNPGSLLHILGNNTDQWLFGVSKKNNQLKCVIDSTGSLYLGDLQNGYGINNSKLSIYNNPISGPTDNNNGIEISSYFNTFSGNGISSTIQGNLNNAFANAIKAIDYTTSLYNNAFYGYSLNGAGIYAQSKNGSGGYFSSENSIGLVAQSKPTKAAIYVPMGNIGIGTSLPLAKLEINGYNSKVNLFKVMDKFQKPTTLVDTFGRVFIGDLNSVFAVEDSISKMSIYTSINSAIGGPNVVRPGLFLKTNVLNGFGAGIQSQLYSSNVGSAAIIGDDKSTVSDNIGILASSQKGTALHAYTNSANGIGGLFKNLMGGTAIVAEGKVGLGTYTPKARLEINSPTPNGDLFRIKKSTGDIKMIIDSSGRMALGDLDASNFYNDTSKLYIRNVVNTTSNFRKSSLNVSTIVSSSSITHGISSRLYSTYIANAAISGTDQSPNNGNSGVVGESDNGIGTVGRSTNSVGGNFMSFNYIGLIATTQSGPFAFQSNGNINAIGNIYTTGSVGMGTNTPTEKLDVNGNITLTGKIINEAWQTPTLNAPWADYGAGYASVRYYKDKENVVHLSGLLNTGAVGSTIFTLGAGYRPVNGTLMFNVNNGNSLGRIDISTAGLVVFTFGPVTAAWVSLDGISFRAD